MTGMQQMYGDSSDNGANTWYYLIISTRWNQMVLADKHVSYSGDTICNTFQRWKFYLTQPPTGDTYSTGNS